MLEKILLFLLIPLIYAEEKDVIVKYLKTNDLIEIQGLESFLVCVQIYEDLPKDDNFYLLISSEDNHKTMDKTLYYNFTSDSCEKPEKRPVNIDSPNFSLTKSDVKLEDTSKGFSYEYEISKKEDNDKYMLFLIRNFNGNKIKIQYSPYSAETLLIVIVVVIVVIIFIIIIVIVIVCLCIRRKKVQEVQQQYQSSFVNNNSSDPNEAIVPRDTIET